MPFVKIHAPQGLDPNIQSLLLKDIRKALVEILEIKETHGHLVLYEAPITAREVHETRNKNYFFIEIQMLYSIFLFVR